MTSIQPNVPLDAHIDAILDSGGRMFLSTSVGGNSSGASVFYARDGDDLVFFTFNPTRKAEQVRANPRVQAVIWPDGHDGIRGLQVEGRCALIRDQAEAARAREAILRVTDAFQAYMDDDFLSRNRVTGYYRLAPVSIKYVDFHAEPRFHWKEFPHNRPGVVHEAVGDVSRRVMLWMRALRAPFFTATLVPVLLGAAIAARDLAASRAGSIDWRLFALVLAGAVCAHAGTNLANDYGDHITGNDAVNQTPSPFNGGSRVIQAGLLTPWKVLFASSFCFALCAACGLTINAAIGGAWYAPTPLLWIGVLGIALGAAYTLGPFRLSYRGLGEPAIALGFGPVIVLGSHYVLTATQLDAWSATEPAMASLPVAVQVMLIVWINQFQDAPADAASDKLTWVVRLSRHSGGFDYRRPFYWYEAFTITAFALVALLAVLPLFGGPGTPWAAIALAPIPLAAWAVARGRRWLDAVDAGDVDWRRHPYALLPVNVATSATHFLTGLLLSLAWILQALTGPTGP